MLEGVRELLAASRHEARRGLDLELGGIVHRRSRLRESRHATGEHERLCLGAALGQAAFDEQTSSRFFMEGA